MEGLTDRQAADAVRRGLEWQEALSLALPHPGVDCTLWPDCRQRLLAHDAAPRLLDPFLATGNTRGGLKARGTPRTDATHVLAAIRTRHRVECVLDARPWALNPLSPVVPAWVQHQVPLAWSPRDGLRSDQTRLPTEASPREAMARQVGADGSQLLAWGQVADPALALHPLPALEARRRMGLPP
jgi:hypothetical protein